MQNKLLSVSQSNNIDPRRVLVAKLKACPPLQAAELLKDIDAPLAFEALAEINPSFTQDILNSLPDERRQAIIASATPELARQWERNRAFESGTLGHFMEPTYAMFRPDTTVDEAIERLRALVKTVFITYGYVTDPDRRLLGLVTMRDLLFAEGETQLGDIMLRNVFVFRPGMSISEAMKLMLSRHYPVYPVCDEQEKLLGLVRGQVIFEAEAFDITAQAGSMVGVDKEERISTPMFEPVDRVSGRRCGGVIPGDDRPDRHSCGIPSGVGRTVGKHRLSGACSHAAGHNAGRDKKQRLAQIGRQGRPARSDEWSAGRPGLCDRHVSDGQRATFTACTGAGAGGLSCDGRRLHHQRHIRGPCSAYAETIRRRPGNRFEHLPDHGHRCREHGTPARFGYDTDRQVNADRNRADQGRINQGSACTRLPISVERSTKRAENNSMRQH